MLLVENNTIRKDDNNMSKTRQAVVDLILSWEGKNEYDGSFKSIIDIYNSYKGTLPRGIRMDYSWAWCACTWSALAIKLGYTSIMPIEISCGHLVQAAKNMGCWKEADGYVAKPGDAILYDWNDSGSGDNTGWPDHIGTIIETHKSAGYFVVMEGNYGNSVKKRTISINGKYIRGFITPAYDDNIVSEPAKTPGKTIETVAREVIAGTWGSGSARKTALESAGYNYNEVQAVVNKILNGSAATSSSSSSSSSSKSVTSTCCATSFNKSLSGTYKTTADLYIRNDAGTNKKALALMPKGTKAVCYGYYSSFNGAKWLYIQATVNGVTYTGFSHSAYLTK